MNIESLKKYVFEGIQNYWIKTKKLNKIKTNFEYKIKILKLKRY